MDVDSVKCYDCAHWATPHDSYPCTRCIRSGGREDKTALLLWEPALTGEPLQEDASVDTSNNGSTASYYELPAGATELYHLINHKNMGANIGEAFRALYRYGDDHHSSRERDLRKVIRYCEMELERLERYES